jgi:NOL1/NOP2/sun family putative RNA methylase
MSFLKNELTVDCRMKPSPGVYLFAREHDFAIKGTDAFYQGKIYLQSLASILPVLALDPQKWEHILDVCAAPGSKTTQIAMMIANEWRIIALEQNQIRYDKLMYNAKLQWATNIEGKKMDARKFFETEEEQFDRILLDAPCSAEWRINLENEKSYGFWTLENIKKKAELQYELLSLSVKSLKNGWTLVYSTCTLAPEENEGVISRLLWEYRDLSLKPIEIGLSGKSWWKQGIMRFGSHTFDEAVSETVRILPSEETEGFYMAKIVKR